MTTEWGAPLTGAQMEALRDAGLPCNTYYQTEYNCMAGIEWCGGGDLDSPRRHRLPADHIAYTLLNAGWLDGRNVRLWFGGETAPDDWDGKEVLLLNGAAATPMSENSRAWVSLIIAYIAKDETKVDPVYTVRAGTPEACPSILGGYGAAAEPETVTIAKMTEAEAKAWCMTFRHNDRYAAYDALDKLGLLKPTPKPTRAERFTAATGIAVTPEILQALEFEQ